MTDTKHESEAVATELLPCPFCGKTPNYVAFGNDKHQIDCDNNEQCLAVAGTPTMRTRDEAVAAWNTRPAMLPMQAAATLLSAGEAVLANWEGGDLAAAVRDLAAAIAEAKGLAV